MYIEFLGMEPYMSEIIIGFYRIGGRISWN